MTIVYLQAFTAWRRERNSWHEVCNVQNETDSRFPVAEDCTVRDGWQPEEMVHRRCWRNHNRSHQMTEGCGRARPAGLSLPAAKSTEGKPQEWAAGRDAVRTAATREVTAESQVPADTLAKPLPGKLRADRKCTKRRNCRVDRNDFRYRAFRRRQPDTESGGRKTKITFRGRIP